MRRHGLSAVPSILIFGAGLAVAADNQYTRASLAGLPGVNVVVESLGPEVEQAGLTTAAIQTDAELKLRLAGIRVVSADDARKEGSPWLNIQTVVTTGTGSWGYSVDLELNQIVKLARDPSITVFAATWSIGSGGGYTNRSNISDRVRAAVKDFVDRFINAYLAVNPKR